MAIAFPRPDENKEELREAYHTLVNESRDEHFAALAKDYQDAIDSLQASFSVLQDEERVINELLSTKEKADQENDEKAEAVLNNLIEVLGIPTEEEAAIRGFLSRFSGSAKFLLAQSLRLAYVEENTYTREYDLFLDDGVLSRA